MKKIVFLLLASGSVITGYSQRLKVNNAVYYYKDYTTTKDAQSLKQAKENIDLASVNPDTKDKAETQVTKGQIYLAMYEAVRRTEEEKLMNIADPSKRTFAALQNTPTANLDSAYQAFSKGKLLDVKGKYSTELKTMANVEIYYDNTGRADFNSKKYPEALAAFERAYEIGGNADTTVLYFCAASADYANDFNKAKSYYQKMIDNKQGRGVTYSSLVNVYLMMKDTVAGMDVLKKGRAAYPSDLNLVISETNYFLRTGKSLDAINNLNIALKAKPSDFSLYLVRGNVYDNLANPKDSKGKDLDKPKDYVENLKMAETDYKKAVELKPDYFDALFNLGVLYSNNGRVITKQADKIMDKAKYTAENAKADIEYNKAMSVLEKALEASPKDKNTIFALKQIYTRLQLLDKLNAMNEKLKN